MALRKNNQKDFDKFNDTSTDVLGNKRPTVKPTKSDTVKVYPNQDLPDPIVPFRDDDGVGVKYEPENRVGKGNYMRIDTTGVPINKKTGMVEEFGGWDVDDKTGKLRNPKGGLYYVKGENVIKRNK